MTKNNVQNIKFLRNGVVFGPSNDPVKTAREVALDAMEKQKANLADGTAILGRYQETNGDVKTLVGFAYISGNTKTLTVFDVDGASADVDKKIKTAIQALNAEITSSDNANVKVKVTEVGGKITAVNIINDNTVNRSDVNTAITNAINELDAPDSAVAGQYVSQVSQADGKIAVKRAALPTVDAISAAGKPITAVSENLGIISASAGTIDAQYVTTSTANTDFTGETVQAALEEISSKVKADKITSADKTITVTTAATGTDVAVNIDGTTLVKNTSTGVISSDLKIKSITQAASSAYASQYQLVYGSSETPIGDVISVGKDQFLKEADYDPETQTLVLKMWNSTGGTTDITVDFSEAIIESEAGDGLYTKADHSLNVGIDAQSEAVITGASNATGAVLSVSADSIKVQNIQNAIDYKVSTLDATVGSTTVASDKHVAVQVSEADGVLTAVTVTERDIANATDLSALSAKSVTAVEMTGGTAAIAANSTDGTKKITINADGASVKATGYSKGSDGSAIVETDSINAALSKLENQVDAAKAAATTEIAEGTDAGSNMSIVETTGASGQKIYTISLSDVASKAALDNEISYRKYIDGINGDAYTANTSNYINDATSLNDADVKLDAQVKTNADDILKNKVKAGNGIVISGGSSTSEGTTVSAKVKNDGGLVVDSDGLHLGYIDAGIY